MTSTTQMTEKKDILEKAPKWFRIAELEHKSGCSRRTIHFYVQEGLLHPPAKTGKTMAYYDETHLKKLAFIKEAKQQGMPLIGIRKQIAELEVTHPGIFGNAISVPMSKESQNDKRAYPQKPQGRKTRESILELGCDLFREKGYKDTKISDITKILNVGKGTFYFYFSDKKELLLECVPRIFSRLFAEGWDQIRQAKNPLERLRKRFEAVMPVLKEFCSIIQISKEAIEDSDPKIKQLGEQTYLSIRHPLETDIKKGIEQGIIKPIDPKITATYMIGAIESLYYLQTIDNNLKPSVTWENVLDLISTGIRVV